MKRCFAVFLLCTFALSLSNAQQPTFNLDDYKRFLTEHQGITAGQVLTEYPSPVLYRGMPQAGTSVRYMDSVQLKYKLTGDEVGLLRNNSFVVTERLSYPSFGSALSDIWHLDLPVFVSTDAILHAVHVSYDEILKATERSILVPTLQDLLQRMHEQALPSLHARYSKHLVMQQSLQDVDVYLTVARQLLTDKPVRTYYPSSSQVVQALLTSINGEKPENVELFSSTKRLVDFSQFTVRGHYTREPVLRRYFQSMIWLGRTEFMLTKPVQQGVEEQTDEDIKRQIADAFLVTDALGQSGAGDLLTRMDDIIRFLVGESDNVKPEHMNLLRQASAIQSIEEIFDRSVYEQFTSVLIVQPFADQRINAQILMSDPYDPTQLKPPSAFLLLGQRFIIDSYVLGNVVYDRILHNGAKVLRMLPKTQDALFALGNNASAQFLQDDMTRYHYGPNLTALRYLVDSFDEGFWNASLYNTWLQAIRSLNPPESTEQLPPFMRTTAWWQEKMNTQLASWAQLRHDNLLYAKQSYTGGTSCSYPDGYVEPFPEFYSTLGTFAKNAGSYFSTLRGMEYVTSYFSGFAATMDTLEAIARKELTNQTLSDQERHFLKTIMWEVPICGVMYMGWYPRLFFGTDVATPDYVVADVHTAPTDEVGNFVGWVVHVGTGNVNMGFFIAPTEDETYCVYTGPVMSFYEHITTNFKRLTDEEWEETMLKSAYSRPDWTNSYLADTSGQRRPQGPELAGIMTGLENAPPARPASIVLHEVFPNPFTNSTLVRFTLPESAETDITLDIYDLRGRRVRSLVHQTLEGGTFTTRWDGRTDAGNDVPSGLYLARLTAGGHVFLQQVSLIR